MNKSNHRSPFAIVGRLIVLVKPMLPIMLAAIVMGVAGHFCATFITIFGGFGILRALGLASPVRTVGTAFACILVFALLRGVLRYAEQASNHYIAFKLLALIRDKVFGALRRLTPAKLEGRDRGDLISLITADIEALEVFYAHTISPICIACICVIGMTGFVGSWHILPALVLLAGYLLVGVALPVWSAKRGDRAAREYRQALADTNSYVLESLRGLKDTLQYQDTAARAEGITAHSEMLGEKQKAMKYREGLTVAITNTLILLTVLAVLAIWILSTSGDSSFAVNYSAVFLGMMPAYLLSYDHASGWTEYSFALPLSKELQVAEKYLVGLLCTAVSAALNGIFCGIRFWMGKPLPAMPISLLLGAGAASILLINGIMLPLYYRFGAEKARMLYMLMFAGMGAALGGGTVLMDAVPEPGAAIAIVGVLAAVLVLYALSWRLSVAWYGKYKK